ncbi:protein of unknown function [Rhodovastum atsumiense]|nr:protein of unknown function [Rhodovastum atsumiense]
MTNRNTFSIKIGFYSIALFIYTSTGHLIIKLVKYNMFTNRLSTSIDFSKI